MGFSSIWTTRINSFKLCSLNQIIKELADALDERITIALHIQGYSSPFTLNLIECKKLNDLLFIAQKIHDSIDIIFSFTEAHRPFADQYRPYNGFVNYTDNSAVWYNIDFDYYSLTPPAHIVFPLWNEASALSYLSFTERIPRPENLNDINDNWINQTFEMINLLRWYRVSNWQTSPSFTCAKFRAIGEDSGNYYIDNSVALCEAKIPPIEDWNTGTTYNDLVTQSYFGSPAKWHKRVMKLVFSYTNPIDLQCSIRTYMPLFSTLGVPPNPYWINFYHGKWNITRSIPEGESWASMPDLSGNQYWGYDSKEGQVYTSHDGYRNHILQFDGDNGLKFKNW